jgi:hypothetical protein
MKPRILIFPAIALIAVSTASAQTWSSTAGGNWSDGLNWDTTPTAPVNDGTADIVFNTAEISPNDTSTVDTAYSINSLTFGNATGAWTLGGAGQLTIGAGGIALNANASQTINTNLTIGVDQTWNPGTYFGVNRTVDVAGTITGAADKTITVSGGQAATLYRKFLVSANNTASLASNWIVDAGGRLSLRSAANTSLGTGTITVNPGGQLGGESSNAIINNPVTLAGGALGGLGNGDGGTFKGNISITQDSFINLTSGSAGVSLGADTTPANFISGAGNLTVYADIPVPTKVMRLGFDGNTSGSTAPNTCTGTLTINTGIVDLSKRFDGIVAWAGDIVINFGATLRYNSFRENLIEDTRKVTINDGGIWNLSHGLTGNAANQQFHETIARLEINTLSDAFINDFSTPDPVTAGPATKARILLGTGTVGPNTAEQGIYANLGGTLSGIGIVNKETTVRGGSLSPGNADVPVGTLTFARTLTLASGLAAGSLKFELGAPTTAGTDYDSVKVDDTLTDATGSILDIGTGLLEFSSFQFTNLAGFAAGTYTLIDTNAAITGTLGAGLSGTINGLNATLSLGDSGTDLVLTVSSGASDYNSWASANSVTGGVNGDSDNDGIKNLVEYALADNTSGTYAGNSLSFNKRGTPYGGDITYTIEESTDLDVWTVVTPTVNDASTISYTFSGGTKKFARLKVTQP